MKYIKIISVAALILALCVGQSEANGGGCPDICIVELFGGDPGPDCVKIQEEQNPCPFPRELVIKWTTIYPILGLDGVNDRDGGSPNDITADCQVACKKWVEGCKGYADAGKECLNKLNEAEKKFEKDGECKTYDIDSAVKTCQQSREEWSKLIGEFIKCETDSVKPCCDALFETCVDWCEYNTDPYDFPEPPNPGFPSPACDALFFNGG